MIERPVFLLGMPRSGTTWLSQVFEAHPEVVVRLSPNFSHALKNRLDEKSGRADWEMVLAEAAESADPFLTQDWRRERGDLPVHAEKEHGQHLVVKDTRYLAVYRAGMQCLPDARCLFVVRDPRATLNSWLLSAEFPKDAKVEDEWRNGACRKIEGAGESWGFEDWCLETRRFLQEQNMDPARYRVFSYERAVREPEAVLKELFDFVAIPQRSEVLRFVEQSHRRHQADAYSVFKDPQKVLAGWRETLPQSIADAVVAELAGTDLECFLDEER